MTRNIRLVIILAVGMAIGYWLAKGHPIRSIFRAKSSAVKQEPVAPAHGELWLADFESEDEISKHWKTRGVVATRSEEHATHGKFSAKVTYDNSEGPAFLMEDYLEEDRHRRDWRGYERLSFDIYNAQSDQQRVILQLKDRDGRAYKEDIVINGKSTQHISVRLDDLKEFLDLGHMQQFNLFRWKPGRLSTFYVDSVRLQPAAHTAAAAPGAGASKTPAVRPTEKWQVTWATSLEKLPRDPSKLPGQRPLPITMSLAGGEYESVQVVLVGGAQATQVRLAISQITSADGQVSFPRDVFEVREVGYVTTRQPYYPVAYVGEWPDPLSPAKDITIPEGKVQPVWITLGAPPTLPAGRYAGEITITDGAGRIEKLPLQVHVWDFVLPATSHLSTAFDFYRYRLEKAYREFVPGGAEWSTRMDELQRLYFLDMLKHRIWPIMGADPTSGQFGRSIDFYLRVGLGMFGVGWRGGSNGNNWPKDPQELERELGWYRQAAQALRSQELLDRAYVYTYDEPNPGDPHVAQVMEGIHWADPQLKNLLVMHEAPDPVKHAEWLKHADILCLQISSYSVEQAKQFTQLGKTMWLYVSSPSHPFPALVIDYPAIAHRILPWMCWKVGAKGLLYWCVNFWNGDPWQDPANFSSDQNGNGALYYPTKYGPVPSIRMEVLRDGMEDYEYLYRLNELIEKAKARGGVDPSVLEPARRLVAIDPSLVDSLRSYSKDPDVLLTNRNAIAEMIEKLQVLEKGQGP